MLAAGTASSRTTPALAVLALLLDHSDRAAFSATGGMVSGHTLKHAVAALAAYSVVRHLRLRRAL